MGEDFRKQVEIFDQLIIDCTKVSQACAGIKAPTGAHYFASVLFTSLCTRGVSMAILLPFSLWATKRVEHWDYSTVAGVTRSIMEVRLAFFYLCSEQCSQEEWDCRWNLFNLHDCTARIRLFRELHDVQDQVEGFENQAVELRSRLTRNLFFTGLAPSLQKQLLNGQTAYLTALEDVATRAGVDVGDFRILYRMFSTEVHGFPMSFYRMSELNRGRGVHSESEEQYLSFCISFGTELLRGAKREMQTLFTEFLRP